MVCKSDVNGTPGIRCSIHIKLEGQNPQIKRPVRIPAIPVSRFRAGKVADSFVRQGT